MRMNRVVFLGLLLLAGLATAQPPTKPRLDSLESLLRTRSAADTNRVKTLNGVGRLLAFQDPAAALPRLQEAEALARRLGYHRGQLVALSLQGSARLIMGDLDTAMQLQRRVLGLARGPRDRQDVANSLNNLGGVFMQRDQYDSAQHYFLRARRLEEQLGNLPHVADINANLGNIYLALGQYEQALACFEAYQQLPSAGHRPIYDATALALQGEARVKLGQLGRARQDFAAALQLTRQHGFGQLEADVLTNVVLLERKQGHYVAAEAAQRRALALVRALPDYAAEVYALSNLADLAELRGAKAEAEQLYRQSLALAERRHILRARQANHAALARLTAGRGDFRTAYTHRDQAAALQDSLLNTAKAEQLTLAQTRFDTERKDARNRLLEKQRQLHEARLTAQDQVIRRRNTQLVAGGVVAALLLLLAGLFYNRARLQQKVAREREQQRVARQRAAAVLAAEEAERRRIGADLHDGVGQLLSVVKLNVNALHEELHPQLDADQNRRFGNTLDLVDESVREVRSISHNLLPNALIKRGLTLAVREFLDKIQRPDRLRIRLETLGLDEARLDPAVENALYRVIQELVQNIIKHARATEMDLQLIRHEHELTLLVEDNGVGFDPAAQGGAGIGLRSIASRVAYLGGTLHVDGRPGRGTTVTATIPMRRHRAEALLSAGPTQKLGMFDSF
jgi:two-component system NarL family sensor kinase